MENLTRETFLAGAKFRHKDNPEFIYNYDGEFVVRGDRFGML